MQTRNNFGFSLLEIIIVIAVLAILSAISVAGFVLLYNRGDLKNTSEEIVNVLELAQNKTLASQESSQYGVYFDTDVSPNRYILFKGADFSSRDTSSDKIYYLPSAVEFFGIDLGGGSETVFNKLIGFTDRPGQISLRLKVDPSQNKTIYVNSSGVIGFNLPQLPQDTRTKDSRHAHINYSRAINTAEENIFLTFNDTVVQQIPINGYLLGSQFSWSGTVNAGGSDQTIEIHTHKLNDPDTQFSVHRDRRLNNAALKITISGDITGTIAEYSSDGLTVGFTSIYVEGLEWQ